MTPSTGTVSLFLLTATYLKANSETTRQTDSAKRPAQMALCLKGYIETVTLSNDGVFTAPNNIRYIGVFDKGQLTGLGIALYPNGSNYIGNWKNWKYHGYGVLQQPDGAVVEGNFENGKFVK